MKALLGPFMRLYLGLRIVGAGRIPRAGAVIVAPNHKSFWNPFFIAAAAPRHLRFRGKSELFEGPAGRLLVRLGAVPVRRGAADAAALAPSPEAARALVNETLWPEVEREFGFGRGRGRASGRARGRGRKR